MRRYDFIFELQKVLGTPARQTEKIDIPTQAMLVRDVAQAYFPNPSNNTAVNLLRTELMQYPKRYEQIFTVFLKIGYQRWFSPEQINLIIKTIGMPGRGFDHG